MTGRRCESCTFPTGPRTGEIHRYRDHSGELDLCDDCIRMAREVYGLEVEQLD